MVMWNKLKVTTKLGLSFSALIALGLIQAGYSWVSLRDLSAHISSLIQESMVKIEQFNHLKDNTNLVARSVRNILLLQNDAAIQAEKNS